MTSPAMLTIVPLVVTVPVATGQSLLEAALAAGVNLPRLSLPDAFGRGALPHRLARPQRRRA